MHKVKALVRRQAQELRTGKAFELGEIKDSFYQAARLYRNIPIDPNRKENLN